MNDATQGYLKLFEEAVTAFVTALKKKFRKDNELVLNCQKYDMVIVQCQSEDVKLKLVTKMMNAWNKTVAIHFDAIKNNDMSVIDRIQHKLFDDLNLQQKFKESKIQTRKAIMKHLLNISTYSRLYNQANTCLSQMPSSIMSKITGISEQIATQGQNVDFQTIFKQSQQLINSLSKEEMQSLNNAGKNIDVNQLMSIVGVLQKPPQ